VSETITNKTIGATLKKRLVIVFSSISLVIGASYFITGKVIQKNYYETIAKINAHPSLKVSVVSYKRGLIHSKADVQLELVQHNEQADRQIIPLRQVITHGPVILANTAHGFKLKILAGQLKTTLGEPWQQKLRDYTHNQQPLVITTLVNFDTKANTWVKIPQFEQTDAEQLHVTMSTLTGEINHDLNFVNYHGTLNLPEFAMHKEDWQFKIAELALKLDSDSLPSNYNNSNQITSKQISFQKNDLDVVKLDDFSAKLAFVNLADNLTLDLTASIEKSQIIQQQFTQDNFKIVANNVNRASLKNLTNLSRVTPKLAIDFVQQLTADSTNFTVELPKYFTEALLSYLSFEIYRSSPLGKFDKRPEQAVLQAISGSINKLVQSAVNQKLFLDRGTHYALNFNQPSSPGVEVSPDANRG
jgi:uncharacterized protein YdgA (DUF945 family)